MRLPGLHWLDEGQWRAPSAIGCVALLAAFSHWWLYLLLAIGLCQVAAHPRSMKIWGVAVTGVWCLSLWLWTGFLAFDPTAWVDLQRKWFANDVVGWAFPIATISAVTCAVAFPVAGAARIEASIPETRRSQFAATFIFWFLIALTAKYVLGEGTFFIRIFIFAGALIVGNFIRGAVDRFKRVVVSSAKDTLISSAERESSSTENVQAARVAAVVREIDTPRVVTPLFQPTERVIAVGGEDRKFDAEDETRTLAEINAVLAEEKPWPDATLDLRKGISQRDLHALFDGSSEEDFEDGTDTYGLLRHLYDPSQAPVEIQTERTSNPEAVEWSFDEAATASLEIVDGDEDDLSGAGVVEAIAASAPEIALDVGGALDLVDETAALAIEDTAEIAPAVDQSATEVVAVPAPELAVSKASSKAIRVLAVYRRLKAEDRLESDFAGRLLPLIDESIEGALCESEEGRELVEMRARLLSGSEFDDPVEPTEEPSPAELVGLIEAPEEVPAAEALPVDEASQPDDTLDVSAVAMDDPPAEVHAELTDEAAEEPDVAPTLDPALVSTEAENTAQGLDDDFQPPADNDITAEEPTEMLAVAKAPAIEEAAVVAPLAEVISKPVVDIEIAELQRLKDWLALDPIPEHDVDRILDERGRERPDEQEIDYTLRRLKEYAPSPSTRRNAIRQASSVLSKEDESFSIEEVSLLKGIICLGASETFTRWGFQGAIEANRKFVFLLFHDVVSRRVGDIEQRLKDGIPDLEAVTAYRALSSFMDDLQGVFPHLAGMVQDFMALLDRAEYDFAFAGRQDVNLLVEGGLVDPSARASTGASVNVGVSRLLASRMPASAQEALSRFISIGKLIEPIDLMIIDEGIRSGDAPEKHPLHPMLMELQYRGLVEIRALHDELKRRPQLRAEIPSIIRTRQEDLGARYEGIVRNQDEIERCVLRNREEAAQLTHLSQTVASMTEELADRDRQLQESAEASKRLPVMDALVSAARQLADRDNRFALVGTSKLKVEVAGGEVAIVFVHGHGMSWQVVNGTKLATEEGALEIDMIKLCGAIRNTHGFSDDGQTRLRIVMVGGELGRVTHNCVFSLDEAMAEPGRLLGQAEIDAVAAKTLNF